MVAKVAAVLERTPHAGMERAYDWCDLDDACSGPVACDLVCMDQSTRIDGAAAVRAYGADVDLRPWRELRRLHATVWYALYAERLPRHRARAAELVAGWA